MGLGGVLVKSLNMLKTLNSLKLNTPNPKPFRVPGVGVRASGAINPKCLESQVLNPKP